MIEKILEKLLSIDYIGMLGRGLVALLMLIIGLFIIKIFLNGIKVIMQKRDFDKSVQSFLISIIAWVLRVFLFISVAGELGIHTTSFAAVIAAMGLAIGMALQGSLSNFAGGVLIIIFKPFRVGDVIESQGKKGVVKKIEIFTTTLNTVDNKVIVIPNGVLSNGIIINYSVEENRRVDMVFSVSYDADINKTKSVLIKVVSEHPLVLKNPEPIVMMIKLNDSSVDYEVKVWVNNDDYWKVYSDMLERVKEALSEAEIDIPYPHIVQIQKK